MNEKTSLGFIREIIEFNLNKFRQSMKLLEKESQYLSSQMLSSGFFVVHYSTGSGQHKEPELTGREETSQI